MTQYATVGLAPAGATSLMASDIVYAIETIDVEGAANDVDPSNIVDNCPTGPCPELMEPATNGARLVDTGSPSLPEDTVFGGCQ